MGSGSFASRLGLNGSLTLGLDLFIEAGFRVAFYDLLLGVGSFTGSLVVVLLGGNDGDFFFGFRIRLNLGFVRPGSP